MDEKESKTPGVREIAPAGAGKATLVEVTTDSVGMAAKPTPTFLELWGVNFLAVTLVWILVVGLVLLGYYLWAVQHQQATAVRENVTYIFDLLITRTTLPICTLLLGYLFGKGKLS